MKYLKEQNQKGSNVYRMNVNKEQANPKDSNIYRNIGCIKHSTPKGSHPLRQYDFSINMLSLRDIKTIQILNYLATSYGEITLGSYFIDFH